MKICLHLLIDLENPLSLDVFETLLHFTTERVDISGKIKTVDKLGRGVPTTLVDRAYLPGGIVVYHEKRYQKDRKYTFVVEGTLQF